MPAKNEIMKLMPSLETYMEHADGHARSVLKQWSYIHWAGNASSMTETFLAVHDLAFRWYLAAKHCAGLEKLNVRFNGQLDDEFAEELAQAHAYEALRKQAFIEAYKAAEEKPRVH